MINFFRICLFVALGWSPLVFCVEIQSILLISSEESLATLDEEERAGVVNADVPLPGLGQPLLDELGDKYLHHPFTDEEMVKIKRAIIRYYRGQQHPLVAVRIVEVDKEKGVVAFVIKEGNNADLFPEGPPLFPEERLEKYFDIQTGENIAQDVLLNNVAWLNHNPFRRTVVTFSKESQEGTTDLNLRKGFPVQFYVGGDNAGNKYTGPAHLYGGLTWDHVLGLNDFIHYQYTCNPHLNRFQSHYGSYISFLPWRHIITLFFEYSLTSHVPGYHGKGKSLEGSVRYTIPLGRSDEPLKQEITLGGDYKNLNTNVFFTDSSPALRVPYLNITQLLVNYSLTRAWKRHECTFASEVFFSPGQLISREGNSSYNRLRPHAKSRYVYGRVTLGDVFQFAHRFSLAGLLRVQGSNRPLLPSEQFGLGGYNTVRGYGERVYNADEALCANVELRFPPITTIKKWKDAWIFLGFIDYGIGYNLNSSLGNASHGYLLGVGPGVRYQIDTHFSARMDYGFRLHKIPGDEKGGGKFHVGVEAIF